MLRVVEAYSLTLKSLIIMYMYVIICMCEMGTNQITYAYFYVLVNSSDKRNVWHTIFGGCVCLEKADWDMMVSQCKDYNWYST